MKSPFHIYQINNSTPKANVIGEKKGHHMWKDSHSLRFRGSSRIAPCFWEVRYHHFHFIYSGNSEYYRLTQGLVKSNLSSLSKCNRHLLLQWFCLQYSSLAHFTVSGVISFPPSFARLLISWWHVPSRLSGHLAFLGEGKTYFPRKFLWESFRTIQLTVFSFISIPLWSWPLTVDGWLYHNTPSTSFVTSWHCDNSFSVSRRPGARMSGRETK